MKKLMIAAAIVCAAAFSQAATYNWQASSDYVIRGDEGETDPSMWQGYSVYFFDANTYSQSSFINSLTTGTDGFANALGSDTVDESGPFSFGVESSGTLTAKSGAASGYAVLIDSDSLGDATYAYIISYSDVTISQSHEGGAQVAFTNSGLSTGEVGGAGWYEIQSVPEPTSGLLLLLGMAGLALRRRRA